MKKFRMKISVLVTVMLALGAACGLAGAVFNIIGLVNTPPDNALRYAVLVLLIILAIFLLVLCASILIFPYYVIKGKRLHMFTGLINTSYDTEDITEIVYFKSQDKLVMYLSNDKFIILLLPKIKHEDFLKALRAVNPKIIYDNKINETD